MLIYTDTLPCTGRFWPSGLVAALTLAKNGVPIRVIEKESNHRIGTRGSGVTVCDKPAFRYFTYFVWDLGSQSRVVLFPRHPRDRREIAFLAHDSQASRRRSA